MHAAWPRVCIREVETAGPITNIRAGINVAHQHLRKDGRVITGIINFSYSGSIGTNVRIFTLPPDFRPSVNQIFVMTLMNTSNADSLIRIAPSGNIYFHDRARGPGMDAVIPFTFIQ